MIVEEEKVYQDKIFEKYNENTHTQKCDDIDLDL